MRILSLHNAYQLKSGEEVCTAEERKLLRENGHEVDELDDTNDRIPSEVSPLRAALRTTWSRESYRRVKNQLKTKSYDLIHVQNFFPLLSPSVYYAAKSQGVPVVQALHNYRLFCADATLFRDGQICEKCIGKRLAWPAIRHACYRDKAVASTALVVMQTAHRVMPTWTKKVDMFVTLTQFMRDKYIEAGFPEDKLMVKPNFVSDVPEVGQGDGNFACYVGRLYKEKGIETLLRAWDTVGETLPLKIIGDGPLAEQVTDATEKNPNITYLGRQPLDEVYRTMGDAKLLVFPSEWYEPFGRVAIEAYAQGTPVIATGSGGIGELIESGRTGLVFEPGNSDNLAAKVKQLLENPEQLQAMRHTVRQEFLDKYTAQRNYEILMNIYEKAIEHHHASA